MHKATMLRAIDAVVDASGIAVSRTACASPQTLCNSYAAEHFETGTDPERVGQWLGFQQSISVHRLKDEQIRERDIARASTGRDLSATDDDPENPHL